MNSINFRLRTSVVVLHANKLLTFFAIDPHDGREFYFLPGGLINEDETAPEAAVRECMEETGFLISVEPNTCVDKEYSFLWNGTEYECLTLFYKGRLQHSIQRPRSNEEPEYNKGVYWMPLQEVREKFSYNEVIQEVVLNMVSE